MIHCEKTCHFIFFNDFCSYLFTITKFGDKFPTNWECVTKDWEYYGMLENQVACESIMTGMNKMPSKGSAVLSA